MSQAVMWNAFKRLSAVALILTAAAAFAQPPAGFDTLLAQARAGDPYAQLNLGALYDHGGDGVERDPALARQWYRRSAEQGNTLAQFNLGHLYATCQVPGRDYAKAYHWLSRAAEAGVADAQYLTGVMAAEGLGTPLDIASARHWLSLAANGGNANAIEYLRQLNAR